MIKKYVIYLLICNHCRKQYTGLTLNNFRLKQNNYMCCSCKHIKGKSGLKTDSSDPLQINTGKTYWRGWQLMVSTFPKAYGCTIFVIDINICCFHFYIISHYDPDFIRTIITHLIVINTVPLTEFFGNCLLADLQLPAVKNIIFNTNCLLKWCNQPVTTCLVQVIFGIDHPRDF